MVRIKLKWIRQLAVEKNTIVTKKQAVKMKGDLFENKKLNDNNTIVNFEVDNFECLQLNTRHNLP